MAECTSLLQAARGLRPLIALWKMIPSPDYFSLLCSRSYYGGGINWSVHAGKSNVAMLNAAKDPTAPRLPSSQASAAPALSFAEQQRLAVDLGPAVVMANSERGGNSAMAALLASGYVPPVASDASVCNRSSALMSSQKRSTQNLQLLLIAQGDGSGKAAEGDPTKDSGRGVSSVHRPVHTEEPKLPVPTKLSSPTGVSGATSPRPGDSRGKHQEPELPQQIAAAASLPGLVDVPVGGDGPSMHRKLLALMALDHAATLEDEIARQGSAIADEAEAQDTVSPTLGGTLRGVASKIGLNQMAPICEESRPVTPAQVKMTGGGSSSGDSALAESAPKMARVSSKGERAVPTAARLSGRGEKIPPGTSSKEGLKGQPVVSSDKATPGDTWMFADATQEVGSLMYMAREFGFLRA